MSGLRNLPGRDALALLLILCAAFLLRARDLQAFRLSPDDGNYLNSARVAGLERSANPLRWLKEDAAWVGELADKYQDEISTYQHSYLHQWSARCLYRLGFDSVDALRLNSVVFGALTALLFYWLFARLFPARRHIGLLAALLLALLAVHAWYSRAGWGVIGCTFFYVVYFALCYELCTLPARTPRKRYVQLGLALALVTVLAYGYHEMIAPYIVAMGVAVLCAPALGVAGGRERPGLAAWLRGPQLWTFVASAVPVGAATLAVYLFSDFAKKYWFDHAQAALPYWEMRRIALESLFAKQRIDLQVSYPVLGFALLGAWSGWRTQRAWLGFMLVNGACAALLLFFMYRDPFLLRIYMPLVLFTALLAAEGVAFLLHAARSTWARGAAVVVTAGFFLYLSAVAWFSLFGAIDHPLFNRYFYTTAGAELKEPRHVDEHLLARLALDMQPRDRVYTFCDKSPVFRLLDVGIPSREFAFEEPRENWPEWILGVARLMERDRHTTTTGGNYELVDTDLVGRIALYRRKD